MAVSNKATKPAKKELIAQLSAERHELFNLCRDLSPQEWNEPSLCAGWRVRDVVAHVSAAQNEVGAYLRTFSENRGNKIIVEKRQNWPIADLLREFEVAVEPNWLTKPLAAGFLWDNWIHQQDVRWVLGENRQRKQCPDRLHLILNGLTKRAALQRKGFRFEATDVDWQAGEAGGEVVRGPAEALIMALAWRPAALFRLGGPGLAAYQAIFRNIKG